MHWVGVCADGDDDQGEGRSFTGHESRPTGGLALRSWVGIGHVWSVKQDVRRERYDDALVIGHHVFCRQHAINAWPGRWMEEALSKRISHDTPNLVAAHPLSAQLGDLQYSGEKCPAALCIDTL